MRVAAYRVVLTQEAQDNIQEITGFIAEQSGVRPAVAVLKRVSDGLRTLERMPQRCPPSKKPWVSEAGGRDYIFLGLPYIAPLIIDDALNTVTVLAVYHGKMNWQI